MTIIEILGILIIGLVAGIFSGTMGIGGGIIIVPALVFFIGFPLHKAQGTSLALMTMPVMFIAAYNYQKEGFVNIKVALLLAATFMIGGFFGSKLSIALPENIIKKIFAVFLIIISIKMFFSK